MANAPYDPSTPIGQVRLHISDTDTFNATFNDTELAAFLKVSLQDPILAAAFALDALAADQARLGAVIKTQSLMVDKKELAAGLRSQAATLRANCGIGGAIVAPDAVFTTDNSAAGTRGTMDGW